MSTTDDVEVYLEGTVRTGSWVSAVFHLADGSTVEVRIPHVVGGSAVILADPMGDTPTIVRTLPDGRTRRGRLGLLFGGS